MKKYEIFYDFESKTNDLKNISPPIKKIIKNAIEKKLMHDPYTFGKPLRYGLKNHRSLRVGDYRVIYRIDDNKIIVIIIAIDHRKNVYD